MAPTPTAQGYGTTERAYYVACGRTGLVFSVPLSNRFDPIELVSMVKQMVG